MIPIIDHKIPEIEQINTPTGRLYKTPEGNLYPSVTTVLSSIPNPALDKWREAVGPEKAKQLSEAATRRGTKIHTWCELFIKQLGFGISPLDFVAGNMFRAMIPEINKFQEIHALETRLWSDQLRVAGSVDCIAFINGELYVVDFKTSGRYKTRDEIPSYFMQCSAYAMAWYERTGMPIRNMRVLITTEDDGLLVYDEHVTDWLPKFVEVRRNYDKLNS